MADTRPNLPRLASLPGMVRWYGPQALLQTGLRDLTARVFGQYADQRVMQAAVDDVGDDILLTRYDYSDPNAPDPRQRLTPNEDGAIWVDYVADVGDGFDSTYAIASLMAQEKLGVEGHETPLPGGHFLIMGGDECYPYASVKEYQRRLIDVYDLTTHHASSEDGGENRKLFLVPGNHDWYDGLSSFDQIFCQRRDGLSQGVTLGPWRGEQHRSYFAIKLPHDWWIWGLDIQLTANLDVGQIKYFHAIARQMANQTEKAKIIVCIATPSWHHGDESGTVDSYTRNLLRILNLAFEKAKVCTVIAGDWHHYTRYYNADQRFNVITSGGGGAYLAPTHILKPKLHVPWEVETEAGDRQEIELDFVLNGPTSTSDEAAADKTSPRPESVFPPRRVSRALSWRVPFQFPFFNAPFWLALGVFYWLLSWMYSTAIITPPQPAASGNADPAITAPAQTITKPDADSPPPLAGPGPTVAPAAPTAASSPTRSVREFLFPRGDQSVFWAEGTVSDRVMYMLLAAVSRIDLVALALLVFVMLYFFFAGAEHRGKRFAETFVCWVLHIAAVLVLYEPLSYTSTQLSLWILKLAGEPTLITGLILGGSEGQNVAGLFKLILEISFYVFGMIVLGGLVAGIISGVLLFIGGRRYRGHADRAFSSMRMAGHKNFLRMKVEPNRLTIYPIGLSKVPRRRQWRQASTEEIANGELAGFVPKTPLRPHLIEGPIVINPEDVRDI